MALPTATVVVPVYDGVADLRVCLAHLQRQDYPSFDVVVADNNSTEDVGAAVPDDPRFRLVHESRQSSYAARNAALAVATGEVLAFTDADCSPRPDWLRRAVDALRSEPPPDMVGGAIVLTFEGRGGPRSGSELHEARHAFRQDRFLADERFAATANMVTWRATLDRVGGFDGALRSGGDMEWGRRVAAAGGRQLFAPDAVVEHPARATLREVLRKARRVNAGHRTLVLGGERPVRVALRLLVRQLRGIERALRSTPDGVRSDGLVLQLRYVGVVVAVRSTTAVTVLGWLAQALRREVG